MYKYTIALALILFCSCYKVETVTNLTEPAIVVDRVHKEGYTTMDMVYEYDLFQEAWVWRPKTVHVPDEYKVTFKCQHGVFTVDRQELYYTLRVDDRVIVTYNESFTVREQDGETTRTHRDFDFISARKVELAELDGFDFEAL